jgi:hypothetical protein
MVVAAALACDDAACAAAARRIRRRGVWLPAIFAGLVLGGGAMVVMERSAGWPPRPDGSPGPGERMILDRDALTSPIAACVSLRCGVMPGPSSFHTVNFEPLAALNYFSFFHLLLIPAVVYFGMVWPGQALMRFEAVSALAARSANGSAYAHLTLLPAGVMGLVLCAYAGLQGIAGGLRLMHYEQGFSPYELGLAPYEVFRAEVSVFCVAATILAVGIWGRFVGMVAPYVGLARFGMAAFVLVPMMLFLGLVCLSTWYHLPVPLYESWD